MGLLQPQALDGAAESSSSKFIRRRTFAAAAFLVVGVVLLGRHQLWTSEESPLTAEPEEHTADPRSSTTNTSGFAGPSPLRHPPTATQTGAPAAPLVDHRCRQVRARILASFLVEQTEWRYEEDDASRRSVEDRKAPAHEVTAPRLQLKAGAPTQQRPLVDLATVDQDRRNAQENCPHGASWTPQLRRFDRQGAQVCLRNKHIVFYGNSNTRTLFTAFEGLLRGTAQMDRLEAKRWCNNDQKNHSCYFRIPLMDDHGFVELFYWSYTGAFFEPMLERKLRTGPTLARADYVIGNAGLNRIQVSADGTWEAAYGSAASRGLSQLFANGLQKQTAQVWFHTTAKLCPPQPHFRKFRYRVSEWMRRTQQQTNALFRKSNRMALEALRKATFPIAVLDGAKVLEEPWDETVPSKWPPHATPPASLPPAGIHEHTAALGRNGTKPPNLCRHYDDPLHHRFADRELIQILLNAWCE